jgi:hypothetical protein
LGGPRLGVRHLAALRIFLTYCCQLWLDLVNDNLTFI